MALQLKIKRWRDIPRISNRPADAQAARE